MERAVPKVEYVDPLQQFRELMPRRVRRVLLVGSRYDFFQLWEDGRLSQHMLSEWLNLQLSSTQWLTSVSSGEDALFRCRKHLYDLVIVTPHIRDKAPMNLARDLLREHPMLTVAPMAFDDRELAVFQSDPDIERFERPFLWQGDHRLLLGIVQSIEDRWNVESDTESVGVSVVILIEDSVHYYSSFLPMIYQELNNQSQRAIAEGTSLHHKIMRLRARPKILHCISYDEAEEFFRRYEGHLIGIISDVSFPRHGVSDLGAGIDFTRMVRTTDPDLPIMLQSNDPGLKEKASKLDASLVLKGSPTLLEELSWFMRDNFGFGDFVFRDSKGHPIARAPDMRRLEELLATVPDDSIMYHAERHHFSTWLKARTEFGLARELRPARVTDFTSGGDIRSFLVDSIRNFRHGRQSSVISDFNPLEFHPTTSFARIGEGSLGGKARGLGFVRELLHNYGVGKPFPDVRIFVPTAVVLATDVFDRFLQINDLYDFALQEQSDTLLEERFVSARLPNDVFEELMQFIDCVDYPLAVRSSSLLEDAQDFSLSGYYRTYMVPNSHPDRDVRVEELVRAIKRVYASTFLKRVKEGFVPSPYRLEEEKMAVIIQRMLGRRHGRRFYPDFAGVVRSHNFYPIGPMKAQDGIARIALGLGETVVEGGKAVCFSPKYPHHPIQFSTTEEILANSQTWFYALELEEAGADVDPTEELKLATFGLETAVKDGTLDFIGSTYSRENHVVTDGLGRQGIPVVTFASILKHETFPLAKILEVLTDVGQRAMNMPVEIEFAVTLASSTSNGRSELAVLQMRPFVLGDGSADVDIEKLEMSGLLCASRMVLGNGNVDNIRDLVVVDRDKFDRSKTFQAATQVGQFNSKLIQEGSPYVLVGVGRWGSADPWLGIPVTWDQIAGAKVIVESDFKDMQTQPSQGSHFFQNLTAAQIGFFTVGGKKPVGFIDWNWLGDQQVVERTEFVRHIRLDRPLSVLMDGHKGHGVILKPHSA